MTLGVSQILPSLPAIHSGQNSNFRQKTPPSPLGDDFGCRKIMCTLGSWMVLFASLGKSARAKFISVKSCIISIYLMLILVNKIGMMQIFLDIFETPHECKV